MLSMMLYCIFHVCYITTTLKIFNYVHGIISDIYICFLRPFLCVYMFCAFTFIFSYFSCFKIPFVHFYS